MDWEMQLRHLAQADQNIAFSKEHIARQHEIIAELQSGGHDTTSARSLLATLLDTQAAHNEHRDMILQELGKSEFG